MTVPFVHACDIIYLRVLHHCLVSVYDITGFCVHSDVDECSSVELNTCDMLCENTVGGFRCDCRNGYQLNQEDGRSCEGTYSVHWLL